MAKVVLPDDFVQLTDGVRELDSEAAVYRDLVNELKRRFPQLADKLDRTAVAIDGQIYQDPFLEPLAADAEVYFMSRIEGG